MTANSDLAPRLLTALTEGTLRRWYPLVLDREHGGYFTNVTCNWELAPEQEKMVVSQARHVWTLSKAARFFDGGELESWARHGLGFLTEQLWDREHGGFFQVRSREGGPTGAHGWGDEKRTYGNAFAVYALAALHELTRDARALESAKAGFAWIEAHAHDPEHGGYFQFLTREGRVFSRGDAHRTANKDAPEVGFKDQNSSIHLLEAYTELYRLWPDPLLRTRLSELLALIRDRMVHPLGSLRLFFERDWTPVSFRDAPARLREENYGLDHVSFGHDYETAFLMLEASHALGLSGDARTLEVAKRMLDHALDHGWDGEAGGFFDGGYYLVEGGPCTILRSTKNWWAQAEALNALALFSRLFPDEPRYSDFFRREWEYVDRYLLDHERGDWFEGGLDKEPGFRTGPKSHLWKCTYHTGRSLMNCVALLGSTGLPGLGARFANRQSELAELVVHWRQIGRELPTRRASS